MERSEHETKFMKEYCKKMMVSVCAQYAKDQTYPLPIEPYFSMMKDMGLLAKREPHAPTAKGWKTATTVLRKGGGFTAPRTQQ